MGELPRRLSVAGLGIAVLGVAGCSKPNPVYGLTGGASAGATEGGSSSSTVTSADDTASATTSTSGDQETTGDPAPDAGPLCPSIDIPAADVVLGPSQVGELGTALSTAAPGTTILLEPGDYPLPSGLQISANDVFLGSTTGIADDVVLDRAFGPGPAISILGAGVTIAHLTIARAGTNAIRVEPSGSETVLGPTLYGLDLIDSVASAVAAVAGSGGAYPDGGRLACTRITATDEGQTGGTVCELGGVRLLGASQWVVEDNLIEQMWCPQDDSAAAISVEDGSRDVVIRRNVIREVYMGIRLGQTTAGLRRNWPSDPCDALYETHVYGGEVTNNVVIRTSPSLFEQIDVDGGILLWRACGTRVLHNTVLDAQPSFSGIEYRWLAAAGGVEVSNNIVSQNLHARQGPEDGEVQASVVGGGNFEGVDLGAFVDGPGGDPHLAPATEANFRAPSVGLTSDIDGDPRGDNPNAGADEYDP